MKSFFLIICLLLSISVSAEKFTHEDLIVKFSEEVYKLSGVNDPEEFDFLRDFAFNLKIPSEQKRELLEKVSQDIGKYPPVLILNCGIAYLPLKDFKKAAEWVVGAVCRVEISVRLKGERSLENLSIFYREYFNEAIRICKFTDAEMQELQKEMKISLLNFERWDRAITWDYEVEDYELTDEEKALVISRFYKEISSPNEAPTISTGEDFRASETDSYYFDWKNRMFYVNDAIEGSDVPSRQFSFHVPDTIMPILDRFGEYDGKFTLSNSGTLGINTHWSKMYEDLFGYKYEQACSGLHEYITGEILEHTVNKCTLDGVPAFKVRTLYKAKDNTLFIQNKTCFQIGNTFYNFEANFRLEDEDLWAEELGDFFNSFKRL